MAEVFIVNKVTGVEYPIEDYIVGAKDTSHNDNVFGRKKNEGLTIRDTGQADTEAATPAVT